MTTIETITDEQIAALEQESGQAGDLAMAAICQIALRGEADERTATALSRSEKDRIDARFPTPAEARAECARVIAAAEAMGD
jgi:hypothetical protein